MKKLLLTLTLTNLLFNGVAQDCDTQQSKATFYHPKYNGRKTTSGEVYSDKKLTAASNDYALGTVLLIINMETGKSVTVRVNDRMANYIRDRIDLSRYAFKVIAPLAKGVQRVTVVKQML